MNKSAEPASFAPARHAFVATGTRAPVPSRPSFADALRQRGLLAKALLPDGMANAWPGASGSWLAVEAIYETHLRRTLMEQAHALLRGDGATGEPAT
jgi:hypothetical protein